MSLIPRRNVAPVLDIEVPNLLADPRLVPALELLAAFSDKLRQIMHRRERLAVEDRLRDLGLNSESTLAKECRAQLKRMDAEQPAEPAAIIAPSEVGSKNILDGLSALRDLPLPISDHAATMAQMDRQVEALDRAYVGQLEICNQIRADLSTEYAMKLKPAWDALHLSHYRSAQEFARATDRVRELQAKVVKSGIGSVSHVLAAPNTSACLMLGSEAEFGSEISTWRRVLERMKIL